MKSRFNGPETVTPGRVKGQLDEIKRALTAGEFYSTTTFNTAVDELEQCVVDAIRRGMCKSVDECRRRLIEQTS